MGPAPTGLKWRWTGVKSGYEQANQTWELERGARPECPSLGAETPYERLEAKAIALRAKP